MNNKELARVYELMCETNAECIRLKESLSHLQQRLDAAQVVIR